jgi:peptidoglycan-associated lipoprotein
MAVLVCACGLLMVGCRTKKGSGNLSPSEIGGDLPLTERIEDGVRITDPAAKMDNILFDYDSFQIKPGEVAKIEKAAEYMKANPRARLVAEGNCDERGSREYNMSLGEQRAGAVRAHLVGVGIDAARIQTKSYGKEKPLNPGHDEKAWAENRRAEFAFYN